MAYQVTGEVLHEWIGMGMTALVIIHQILNQKWYGAIFCRNSQIKTEEKKNLLLPVVFIMGAIILGLVINMISGGTNKEDFGGAGWSSFDTEVMTASSEEEDVFKSVWKLA